MKKRLCTAILIWRQYGASTLFRFVLFKVGLNRSFRPPWEGTEPDAEGHYSARQIVQSRFGLSAPLRVYSIPPSNPARVSMITDSINSGSLFGGVGTAMILAALLAEARQARLRIMTRTERARPENLDHVLGLYGICLQHEVEFAYAPFYDYAYDIDVFPDELFITTSWWTTAAATASLPADSIVYLLQEDERTFYPLGDDRLRCDWVLGRGDIRYVINTRLLYDHLLTSGLGHLAEKGSWFEPAFPRQVFHPRSKPEGSKRRLLFYARPNNLRNLFYFGIEVLDYALLHGVIDQDEWDVLLVGKDIPEIAFCTGYVPERFQNLPWADYADLVGTADVGFTLMSSVHPSYPPLDLAASGAVVVTNRWGAKQDLACYSRNILCGDLQLDDMIATLADGVRLAVNEAEREQNYHSSPLGSSWREALAGVVADLAEVRCR